MSSFLFIHLFKCWLFTVSIAFDFLFFLLFSLSKSSFYHRCLKLLDFFQKTFFLSFYIFVDTFTFFLFLHVCPCSLSFFTQKKVSIFVFIILCFLDILLFCSLSWTSVFPFFSSLIVLFECISFLEILFDLTTALFLFSPFTFFLQKKNKTIDFFLIVSVFCCLSFWKKYGVSLLFLLFIFSEGETFHHVFSFFLFFSSFQQTFFSEHFVYSFWNFLFFELFTISSQKIFSTFCPVSCLFTSSFLFILSPLVFFCLSVFSRFFHFFSLWKIFFFHGLWLCLSFLYL